MSDRALMQQALDALEDAKALLNSKYSADTMWFAKEITALRARLAEPEPKPVAWGLFAKVEGGEFHLQHPVRFSEDDAKNDRSMYERDTVIEIRRLYDRMPTRRPLTDEEIMDAVRESDLDWHTGWSLDEDASNRYITFARAIERKITGGNDE